MRAADREASVEGGAGGLRPVFAYAVAGAGVVGIAAACAIWLAPTGAAKPIGWAALGAYLLQVAAFTAIWSVRRRVNAFLAAWGGGTLARLGAVLGLGLWLVLRDATDAAAPLLLSFAGFLFVLLLMEPLFFRAGLRNQ